MTNDCLDLPSEGPHVISVLRSARRPPRPTTPTTASATSRSRPPVAGSATSSARPVPDAEQPGAVELPAARRHRRGPRRCERQPDSTTSRSCSCDRRGRCGFYTYLQGTSMASPHAAGRRCAGDRGARPREAAAALARPRHGRRDHRRTATDHACPAGGVEIYTDEGRPAEFNAMCEGNDRYNGLYGEGIINAAAAVARR